MRAKKHLGQNFLRDHTIVTRIVDELELDATDTVIEIGPGRGALSAELLDRAERVIAIEFDRDMVAVLRVAFALRSNLQIVNEDALSVDFASLTPPHGTVKLVANLPYNISTPILQRLLNDRMLFSRIVLMFQREVVDRITAVAGSKDRGYLSVLVENSFTVKKLFDVPPNAFTPIPKVWSSVVRLVPKQPVIENELLMRDIVSASFSMRRKTLLNNLSPRCLNAARLIGDAEIDGRRRAETLTLEEWARLTSAFEKHMAGEHE